MWVVQTPKEGYTQYW
jgi:hypothetical protein